MTAITFARIARVAAWTGLVLTVVVTVLPFLDGATQILAEHIRSGYPDYTDAEIGAAVSTWQIVLTVLSGLGILGWAWTIWSVRAARRWTPWSATALLAVAVSLALTLLTVQDTSGEVGLAPALGWIWAAPCLAGVAVAVASWRYRAPRVHRQVAERRG